MFIGELSTFIGKISSSGATLNRAQGVVAFGPKQSGVTFYLDCNGTNNAIGNLVWRRLQSASSLSVSTRSKALRLDLTSESFAYATFVCSDQVTGETVSIIATTGMWLVSVS